MSSLPPKDSLSTLKTGGRQGRRPTLPLWFRGYPFPNGDILVITTTGQLLKLDKNSHLLWRFAGGAHHGIARLPNGEILALTRESKVMPGFPEKEKIVDDAISRID